MKRPVVYLTTLSRQYRRMYTRGQLSACNLKGNKERAKRKNYKAKCRGNDGIEHRLGVTAPTSRKAQSSQPSKRWRACCDKFERDRNEWNDRK